MKWMVASDLHGSATVCEKLLAAYRRERADKLEVLIANLEESLRRLG